MEEIFIKNIHINKVRHLENIDIPISETERKHLILTGKNGSGKTSVLLEVKNWLSMIENGEYLQYIEANKIVSMMDSARERLIQMYASSGRDKEIHAIKPIVNDNYNKSKAIIKKYDSIDISYFSNEVVRNFSGGHFILTFFGAKRNLKVNTPNGINKVQTKKRYGIDDNIGKEFVQHIVNLKADSSFARDDNDLATAHKIDNWFVNFEKSLQEFFEDKHLRLLFQRNDYNFQIFNNEKGYSDFTTLSDGYSAIFNIISELIMRMDNKASKSYDIQGIVLIDEIETHLHIDLQKKILPFLTNFFPKIQFIVTTHSPFVLNSVNNAVIFDLEKKLKVEDLSGYSINSIIESYFDSDDYSDIVKKKVVRYEMLSQQEDLSEEEEDELFDLKEYFEDLPKMFSPELALKINQIQLAKLAVK